MISYLCYAVLASGRVVDLSGICQENPVPVAIQVQAPAKPAAVPTVQINYQRIAYQYAQGLCVRPNSPENALANALYINKVKPEAFNPPGQFQVWVDQWLRQNCKR